jgi:hypothetical protein
MTTVEPTIDLSAMAQKLLKGALEKDSIDEAVRQIYDNMFRKTGWKYRAGASNTSGRAFIDGTTDVGMCESYRNAFAEIVGIYDRLRKDHSDEAVREGTLDVELGNELSTKRFVTRDGLTLMGKSKLKGNVYLDVEPNGNVLGRGLKEINRFVFSGHWTLKVNENVYDPIFYSINVNNVDMILGDGGPSDPNGDRKYGKDEVQFLATTEKPIPTGEFTGTFIRVSDFPAFLEIFRSIAARDKEVGAIENKTERKKAAKSAFVENGVENRKAFAEVVEVAYERSDISGIKRDEKKAFDVVYAALK